MRISDILAADRIYLDNDNRRGKPVASKEQAIQVLSGLLATALDADASDVERLLLEREGLQSTGIGDGVAIPHTSLESARRRAAALLICPQGVPFDAIDDREVRIVLGVVGPKDATSEHLRVLARISRLLRDADTREALVGADSRETVYALIEARDRQLG